jgi:hypothetical protein
MKETFGMTILVLTASQFCDAVADPRMRARIQRLLVQGRLDITGVDPWGDWARSLAGLGADPRRTA